MRGRVVVAAVAMGAFAAATAGQALGGPEGSSDEVAPLADTKEASAAMGMGGAVPVSAAAPEVLTVAKTAKTPRESQKMADSVQLTKERADRLAAKRAEANRPKFVKPTEGHLTSAFGARWGTTHYGIDIANGIGTPIVSVADGVVIEAGPASGFGLWVRVQHTDGTVSVYGHVDQYTVYEGQQVKAGDQIATMGNRGYSTGPHLHLEIWDANGMKLDPIGWLASHGISL